MSMFGVYYLRVPSFILGSAGNWNEKGYYRRFCHGLGFRDSRITLHWPCPGQFVSLYRQHGKQIPGILAVFVFAWGLGVLLIVLGNFFRRYQGTPEIGRLDGNS